MHSHSRSGLPSTTAVADPSKQYARLLHAPRAEAETAWNASRFIFSMATHSDLTGVIVRPSHVGSSFDIRAGLSLSWRFSAE